MIKFDGYEVLTQLYESANSLVYRGLRQQDQQPVILKILKQDYPTPAQLTRYKQEYEITRNLNLEGVIKVYGLEPYQRTLCIIIEDFGAASLKELITSQSRALKVESLELRQFLKIAIKTTEILGNIHGSNIVHKDINPANIIFNPQTEQLKIIDFGISTQLTRENPTLKNPNVLEGTLAYISPEQTGRMNRSLDYRTDFYSLGVTFYELLTGKLPFQATDTLELVHCHLAKVPLSPHQINPQIPKVVADIVLKLMAKTAEERYQSAFGITYDLAECLHQLQTKGKISDFPLGSQDISDHFQIPQKLYGREGEVETLLEAFGGVADNLDSKVEMMLVAGYSGIGKSALVQELYKPITAKRGYFIAGKFEQFQRNIPYSAIVRALQGLIQQLLTENTAQLEVWRTKFLRALGVNAQVIIEVIPELELIVGEQSPVPELGANEAQNRFNLSFQNFLRSCCDREHPLVIFLDDLQWADLATLKLLELISTDLPYLFLIGAYRDNEVNRSHPLAIVLEQLKQKGVNIKQITLQPLGIEDISRLLAETLTMAPLTVKSLANLVLNKTGGNPFFVNQFLQTLYKESLINFDRKQQQWQWQEEQIEAQNITDNVVELMVGNLKKLPEATQEILQLAACVGGSFNLSTLAIISEKEPAAIFSDLMAAVKSGFIVPLSELDEELLIQNYQFLHDRVQQAAYGMIPDLQKQAIHLKIGQLLLANTPPELVEDCIFDIVNQLNQGINVIENDSEKITLAELNLIAGHKAKANAAYEPAFEYLSLCLGLLTPNSWQNHYDLTLKLYQAATEAAYLSGNFEQMEIWATSVLQQAKNQLDKVKVYEVKIQACIAQTKLREAVLMVLQAISSLGVNIGANPTQSDSNQALLTTAAKLQGKSILELSNLPMMSDPAMLAVMRLLGSANAPAYTGTPELLPLIVCQQVNLSIEHGNSDISSLSYAFYGAILCGNTETIETGYQFGQVALSLLKKFTDNQIKARTLDMVFGMIKGWKAHLRKTLNPLEENYQIARDNGTFDYAGYSILKHCYYQFLTGQHLGELAAKLDTYIHALGELKQFTAVNYLQRDRQAVLHLIEGSESPTILTGRVYDEAANLPLYQQAGDQYGLLYFYLNKLILSYLFEDQEAILENGNITENYLAGGSGLALIAAYYFYDSLGRSSLYLDAPIAEQETLLSKIQSNQEKMLKFADYAPMNFQHKYHLVAAEKARVLGEHLTAMELYDRAIEGAKKELYWQEEALANELAGKFYLSLGRAKIAETYLKEARYGYLRWGALAKVKHLEQKYPQLLTLASTTTWVQGATLVQGTTNTITHTATDRNVSVTLDFATVMKASQAISSEIFLDKLLASLMKMMIENAGAESGFLLLEKKGEFFIEAIGEAGSNRVTVLQSIPLENRLPISVINYVVRTQETIVKDDAYHKGKFTNDPYIQKHQTKSMLSAPLSHQGRLIGIIYLENSLTIGAFTPDRLEVLKLLSGQAAISLENARLYQSLEDKVEERTAQLQEANEEILELNERLKAENLRMSAELEVTKKLQQMVLPREAELAAIEGLEIAGYMEPADEVGGDYYDVLQDEDHLKISIGDVTGHGLESGLLMIMAQTAIRTLKQSKETDPVRFLNILNQTLYDNLQRMNIDKSMTLTLLDYHHQSLQISGQHESIIVVRNTGEVEIIDTVNLGFPLGLEAEISDFIAQEKINLNAGDTVVLYTDGITEAENLQREQYGLERLAAIAQKYHQQSALIIRQAVINDVREHIGQQQVFDDLTLVILKQK